ncbi:stromelysin-2 [Aethina tumida]|uniref:stromelysin-2 n=1 Tax=Aethina tumida TaxID=116153 RepID=UPI00214789D4|nr:stromelysin-2 [Aethina tumida]
MRITLCCGVLLVLIISSHSYPVNKQKIMKYLSTYGYMDEMTGDDNEKMTNGLKQFQEYFGLEPTGKMDSATKEMMGRPRCANTDKKSNRLSKWNKTTLTYKIVKYPPNEDESDVRAEVRRSFSMWANRAPLTFQETTGDPDIEIGFYQGAHGDNFETELAHAYFPPRGDIHLNLRYRWGIFPPFNNKEHLLATMVHEIGHSLGIDHNNNKKSVMYPYSQGYDPAFGLSNIDIQSIQNLYGTY